MADQEEWNRRVLARASEDLLELKNDSWLEEEDQPQETTNTSEGTAYVINTNSGKFHLPTCSSVEDMSPGNRQDYVGDRQELLEILAKQKKQAV